MRNVKTMARQERHDLLEEERQILSEQLAEEYEIALFYEQQDQEAEMEDFRAYQEELLGDHRPCRHEYDDYGCDYPWQDD